MLIEDIENHSNKVVIIKGNPDKIKGIGDIANDYYIELADYIESKGFNVEFDDGEPYTCPNNAAFWIGHSRGVDREQCISEQDRWRFLKFGVLDGVIHPKDEQWQQSLTSYDVDELPPKEHFEFTEQQQKAIDDVISKID